MLSPLALIAPAALVVKVGDDAVLVGVRVGTWRGFDLEPRREAEVARLDRLGVSRPASQLRTLESPATSRERDSFHPQSSFLRFQANSNGHNDGDEHPPECSTMRTLRQVGQAELGAAALCR